MISGPETAARVALATYRDKLYCVHRGKDSDTALRYVSFDGNTWSAETAIPGASSSVNSGLAVYNDKLYCVHRK